MVVWYWVFRNFLVRAGWQILGVMCKESYLTHIKIRNCLILHMIPSKINGFGLEFTFNAFGLKKNKIFTAVT